MPAALDRLPLRDGEGAYRVVIEATQGSRNKLNYEPESRTLAQCALPRAVDEVVRKSPGAAGAPLRTATPYSALTSMAGGTSTRCSAGSSARATIALVQ